MNKMTVTPEDLIAASKEIKMIDDKAIKELLVTLDDIARDVDYDFGLPLGGDSEAELIKATKRWLDSLHSSTAP